VDGCRKVFDPVPNTTAGTLKRKPMPHMPPKLRDLVFAEIDGWYVIPLGIGVALFITVVPILIAQGIATLFFQ
jgi:hypothetical protein